MSRSFSILLTVSMATGLFAGDRISSDYSVQSDAVNSGGGASASASYTHHGSLGALPVAQSSGDLLNKNGHLARIFDITDTVLELLPAEVDEQDTATAEMRETLDDGTRLRLAPADYTWTEVSGPISVFSTGLVIGLSVYEDTSATLKTTRGPESWSLNLTVRDALPDNYGSYSGDGLPDSWQVLHFGLNNPDASPTADPDHDQQDNAFEETAGTLPGDPASRFLFSIQPHPSLPAHVQLLLSPRYPDRIYTVRWAEDLSGTPVWNDLPGAVSMSDNGDLRTITDPLSAASRRFYKVQISKP